MTHHNVASFNNNIFQQTNDDEEWGGIIIAIILLSLERYGDQQLRRRACPEFVADRAMFLMLLEVILFL